MAPPPLKVLHVVSGLGNQGGLMSFVTNLVSKDQPVEHSIWKHRDFKAPDDNCRYICEGNARYTDRSLLSDIFGALREVIPLTRWLRGQEWTILHAHSRMGIF